MSFKIQSGNMSNNNQSVWYTESDEQAEEIKDGPGTVIIVNETNNFHIFMIQEDGNLNNIDKTLDDSNDDNESNDENEGV